MRKEASIFALIVGLGFLVMSGCGGSNGSLSSSPSTNAVSTGSVALFGTDYPLCDVVSFTATITGATLTPTGGGTAVSILSSGQSITVDFARLVNFNALLDLTNVPTGNYNQITLTLSNPQLTVVDTSKTPPVPVTITPTTLTTSTPSANISPALVVGASESSGLLLDFNLRKSVQTDTNGQVTGAVDPVMEARATNHQSGQTTTSVGKIENLDGIIQTVTTTGATPFTGSFTFQTYGGIGPVFTVNVTSSTTYSGVTDLNGLSTDGAGTFVEVNGYVDGNGNVVAQYVEVEEQTSTSRKWNAFTGQVIGVTYDSSGNATQFNLLVGMEFPFWNSSIPRQSSLTVTLSSTTRYVVTGMRMFWPFWQPPNPASFTYGPTSVGVGQNVVVHGTLQSGTPITLAARAVYLSPQTILGNYTALLAAGTDGVTGGFTMQPCGLVFQAKPIPVLTFQSTNFSGGISGLSGLTTEPTLAVRGTIFYQQTSGTLNGASWTAPTLVDQATDVRQLPQ